VTAALAAAVAGDEIWVAQGTYPERIQLKSEVALYRGFAGGETPREQRDWHLRPTILDGGKGGIVVRCEIPFATPANRIDGFVIRNGRIDNNPQVSNQAAVFPTGGGTGGGMALIGRWADGWSAMAQTGACRRKQNPGNIPPGPRQALPAIAALPV
jgi:hypothetical protein